ncbi:hypothetical protein COLO4_37876 [Corchorus olitorius]|uniref:Terpene synthase metal-binding domain-containing protein n=1 Tax=Corchorus olitorius TaxID=93759 RepID=A0A1R3FYG8_9ROSI|nr:hypothetical protein COLO4_37876 [Corchorus olitorius]
MVRAFDFEARCKDGGIVPTFDEFMKNAMLTSAVPLFLALSMIGVEEADENTYQWVTNYNDSIIVKGFCIVEEKRGLVTAQACYMKQFGVSKEEAIEGFKEIAEVGWKDVNEGFMRPTPVVREIVDIILNGCRLADVFYKNVGNKDNDIYHVTQLGLFILLSYGLDM